MSTCNRKRILFVLLILFLWLSMITPSAARSARGSITHLTIEVSSIDTSSLRAKVDATLRVSLMPRQSYSVIPLPFDVARTGRVLREPGDDEVPFSYGTIPRSDGISAILIPPSPESASFSLLIQQVSLTLMQTAEAGSSHAIELRFDEARDAVLTTFPKAKVLSVEHLRYFDTGIERSSPQGRTLPDETSSLVLLDDGVDAIVLYLERPEPQTGLVILLVHLGTLLAGLFGSPKIPLKRTRAVLVLAAAVATVLLILLLFVTVLNEYLGDLAAGSALSSISLVGGLAIGVTIRAIRTLMQHAPAEQKLAVDGNTNDTN